MNKLLTISTILFIILICFVISLIIGKNRTQDKLSQKMTFEVEIPSNTPDEDTVHIYTNQESFKMSRLNEDIFSIKLSKEQLGLGEEGGLIKYRYSRNGYSFHTAEYLEPDTNDYFWTQKGREVNFEKDKVQKDIIERWRWFPLENIEIIKTSDIEPVGLFQPRINNYTFRSGQVIEDLYTEAYDDFFESTAKHLVEVGYNRVELDPPWQWTEVNGLPKVENLYKDNPNYPNDEKFIEEVRAFKKYGLEVTIQPQICCTELSTDNRSDEWWNAYFTETTKFLVHFAKIAEAEGIDSMHYAVGSWDVRFSDKWIEVFKEIRKYYSGEVGEMLWNFGGPPGVIIPTADEIKWGNELDYFYVAIDTPISTKDNPTDDELKTGADTMLNGIKQLYDKYKKPVIIRTTYFNIKYTWKGNNFYSIGDVPWIGSEEKELINGKYSFDRDAQARVVNAYFRSIAERPWIIGYGQFGYSHWENPLSSELSVRGKPSEDVWRKWNNLILKTSH